MRENEDLVVYRSSKHSDLTAGKTNLKLHVLVTARKEERQGKKRTLECTGSLHTKCSGSVSPDVNSGEGTPVPAFPGGPRAGEERACCAGGRAVVTATPQGQESCNVLPGQ